jgi:hypothetical protein
VNKTLAAGSTHQDHYNALMEVFAKHGIKPGYVPPGVLTKIKFPRAVPLFGMARDHMRRIAQAVGCTWSITDDTLDLVPIGEAKPGDTTVINADTGMIGMPMQTSGGIIVRVQINPRLRPKQKIKLDNASIQRTTYDQTIKGSVNNEAPNLADLATDGVYTILAIDALGDTHGDAWYQDLNCYARGGSLTKSQTQYTTFSS